MSATDERRCTAPEEGEAVWGRSYLGRLPGGGIKPGFESEEERREERKRGPGKENCVNNDTEDVYSWGWGWSAEARVAGGGTSTWQKLTAPSQQPSLQGPAALT